MLQPRAKQFHGNACDLLRNTSALLLFSTFLVNIPCAAGLLQATLPQRLSTLPAFLEKRGGTTQRAVEHQRHEARTSSLWLHGRARQESTTRLQSCSEASIRPTLCRRTAMRGILSLIVPLIGIWTPEEGRAAYIDDQGMMKSGRKPVSTFNFKTSDDEFELVFGRGPLGLDLQEVRGPVDAPKDQQKSRIVVKGLKPGSEAEALQLRQPRLQEGVQVISVEGYNIEGMSGSQAIKFLGEKKRETVYEQNPFRVLFRDVAKSK